MSLNSELKIPLWLRVLPFVMLTVLGVGLRFAHLEDTPFAIDADQAKVLSWGTSALANGEVRIYANEETQFEALSSYLFAAAEKLIGNSRFPGLGARTLSLIFSLIDMILLGMLLYKNGSLRMWQGIALLATCPWAIFYARIFGPCVGVSGLLMFELISMQWLGSFQVRLVTHFVGLLYYSLFRVVIVYDLTVAALQKKWKQFVLLFIPVVGLVALGLIFQGHEGIGLRGLYNFPALNADAFSSRVTAWLSLWFWSPASSLSSPIPQFIVDPVSMGFAMLLAGGPALGLGLIPLFVTALFRLPDFWKTADASERKLSGLFLFVFFVLILSPTYSHALLIVPLIPYLILRTLTPLLERKESLSMIFGLSVFVAGLAGLTQSLTNLQALSLRGGFEVVFPDSVRVLFETEISADPVGLPRSYFTPQSYHTARYWAENITRAGHPIDAYPPLDLQTSLEILSVRFRESRQQLIYFDSQVLTFKWNDEGGLAEAKQRLQDLEIYIRERFEIVEKKDIFVYGKPVARRYLIQRYP